MRLAERLGIFECKKNEKKTRTKKGVREKRVYVKPVRLKIETCFFNFFFLFLDILLNPASSCSFGAVLINEPGNFKPNFCQWVASKANLRI